MDLIILIYLIIGTFLSLRLITRPIFNKRLNQACDAFPLELDDNIISYIKSFIKFCFFLTVIFIYPVYLILNPKVFK